MRNLILSALLLASAFQTALGEVDGEWTYIIENGGATITASTATGAVTIPSELGGYAVKQVGNGWPPAFNNTSVTSVVIPNSVTSIGHNAFTGCTSLTSMNIPDSVTSIGNYAFQSCTSLASITIPFYTSLGDYPFYLCTSLASITRDFTSLVGRDDFLNALVIRLASTLASNDAFVTAVANKILAKSGNYGLSVKSELETLATKSELTSSLAQSRTDGINSVLSNPNLWTLYTTSQIQNMAVGDLVLTKNVGGTFTLNYDIEQSADLQTWTTYAPLSLPLTGLPTDKAFVRIKAKQ